MTRDIYVNLPVKNLGRSVEFFTKLGFEFNPQFTDKNGTCMIINDHAYVMLLTQKFFKTFMKKQIANTTKITEVINAFSVESRDKVDEILEKAIAMGATTYRDADDHGWMYVRAFQDLDGHLWEVLYADASKFPQQ